MILTYSKLRMKLSSKNGSLVSLFFEQKCNPSFNKENLDRAQFVIQKKFTIYKHKNTIYLFRSE